MNPAERILRNIVSEADQGLDLTRSLGVARAFCFGTDSDRKRRKATRIQRSEERRAKAKREREEKTKARRSVREAVMERADWTCENCGETHDGLELDHFFGRARAESVETCWALCTPCHWAKTENRPTHAWWLERFILHARSHGYEAETLHAINLLGLERAQHPEVKP